MCAHNEEAVSRRARKKLKGLDYPDELYDIFVVADNCTDKTAEVASAAGANVYTNVSIKKEVGKGMPWGGCLTAWIKWIGNMMHSSSLMLTTWYTLNLC